MNVQQLKEKVEKEKGAEDYPAIGQKLIYAGKILQDDTILETYNIDPKKFLVIMVTKPKAPASSGEPADPTVVAEEMPSVEPADNSSQPNISPVVENLPLVAPTLQPPSFPPSAVPSAESVGSAESALVMGEDFNKMVDNIMEMGYERTQVERALRASFNNPYTAVQYLVDGIPANLDDTVGPPAQVGGEGEEVEMEGDDEDALAFLRSQPQFAQMRQMIRSNPQLLDAFIQQIGQTNPQLLQVIQQNQEAFVRMLNESPASTVGSSAPAAIQAAPAGGVVGGGHTIAVSPQDRDAIDRLKSLGNFPEDVVIQAYFACEKNENLAAEFLFSQTWD